MKPWEEVYFIVWVGFFFPSCHSLHCLSWVGDMCWMLFLGFIFTLLVKTLICTFLQLREFPPFEWNIIWVLFNYFKFGKLNNFIFTPNRQKIEKFKVKNGMQGSPKSLVFSHFVWSTLGESWRIIVCLLVLAVRVTSVRLFVNWHCISHWN